ncbi:hypothetical protein HG536_0B02970 [Torulaspora globosa]|uniref:Uncharacterized protein n=1 Tax=Torulaspora globosa TaxID=48254 RepID=A0A7G3ZD48_9SACH|nr:uncharacterized protein HG536_0B02970 [Torulaspora globosa]QLL31434.1 hypothetical protein HG536_0B02970 [Torulaspora globosa]
MRISSAALAATLIGSVSALPHLQVKRDEDCVTTVADAHQHKRAVAVEYVYQTITVDGHGQTVGRISDVTTPTSTLSPAAPSSVAVTTSSQAAAATTLSSEAQTTTLSQTPSSSSPAVATSSAETSSSAVAASSAVATSSAGPSAGPSSSTSSTGGISGDLGAFSGPSEKFQDGTIPCSQFPAGQGVISLDWVGLGGWSGVENADTSTGGNCKDGSYCSYACQAGMSKTQWPSSQPADGRSIGGLYCKGGFLYRSNTNSDYLCEWGVPSASVVSKLNQDVAICRTDYPGTENMVIPTLVGAGQSQPLTVVDQDSYYTWRGMKTSAQYYVNNAGVSVEDGCVWGDAGSGIGNWAPLNFGAGQTGGITYLSLIPNPNNKAPLNFNVKIVAADSSSVVQGECYYENGKYNGNGADGCTVAVTSGSAHFVLY